MTHFPRNGTVSEHKLVTNMVNYKDSHNKYIHFTIATGNDIRHDIIEGGADSLPPLLDF